MTLTHIQITRSGDECLKTEINYNGTHSFIFTGKTLTTTIDDKLNSICDGEEYTFALSETRIYAMAYKYVIDMKEITGPCFNIQCCMYNLYAICQNKEVKWDQKDFKPIIPPI